MEEDKKPLFSILIPTWNNLGFLKLCMDSIEKNSAFAHQIIVYVNDGSDGTLDYVKEKGIDYAHSPSNVGICFALNALRPLVKTDYILYMNDDMYVCPQWDKYLWDEIVKMEDRKMWFLSATLIQPRPFYSKSVIAPANYGESVEEFDEDRLLAEYNKLPHHDCSERHGHPTWFTATFGTLWAATAWNCRRECTVTPTFRPSCGSPECGCSKECRRVGSITLKPAPQDALRKTTEVRSFC